MRRQGFEAQLSVRGLGLRLLPSGPAVAALVEQYPSPSPGSVADSGQRVLDLRGHTVLPGLVGMHDHLYHIARPNLRADGTAESPVLVPQMTFSAPRLYLAAGVTTIRNPIRAARAVMEKSPHVLLSGKGACAFAREQGLEMVSNRWFFTRERHDQLKSLKKRLRERSQNDNHGTVGCVALDQYGHLCAGTSTGGMTGKRFGRIGDTPLIGAGTWASAELTIPRRRASEPLQRRRDSKDDC